tara:strand:+ start:547 stop:768 length:222 start_codon:yes stop_codon:yes gene_type:complete
MSRTTANEVDKRLLAHESACAQRWEESYRRFDAIDASLKSLNLSIRGILGFTIVTLLGIVGYFANLVITFNIT